ncbi:PIN domain-containing protein [Rubrobacter indicoceani]|uniref:PIN domain-containing protein n=1 Tax=Rubrobacter indicoceani TaxID=2051957 RepID=UPI003B832544
MRSGIGNSGKSTKPMDAIHLASAKRLGVDALHTYDGDMRKVANQIGLANEEPNPDNLPLF